MSNKKNLKIKSRRARCTTGQLVDALGTCNSSHEVRELFGFAHTSAVRTAAILRGLEKEYDAAVVRWKMLRAGERKSQYSEAFAADVLRFVQENGRAPRIGEMRAMPYDWGWRQIYAIVGGGKWDEYLRSLGLGDGDPGEQGDDPTVWLEEASAGVMQAALQRAQADWRRQHGRHLPQDVDDE